MDLKFSLANVQKVFALFCLALAISACGGGGGGSEEREPPAPNQPPAATAGADQSVVEGNVVTLSATGSSDTDGSIASYFWAQTDGPAATLLGADTATSTFEPPLTDAELVLTFEVTVTDNDGAADSATTSVTVEPSQPPVVAAGPGIEAVEREGVSMDGSASDLDGTIAGYSWAQSAGPAVSLTAADTADPSFTAPVVTDITELQFDLIATDNTNDTAADVVTVTVNPNEPPELAVRFPYEGSRFYGDAISVSGTVTSGTDNSYVTGVDGIDSLMVDAGGQSVDAIVQTDGQWIAQNVPVPDTSAALSLSITATDRFGEISSEAVDLSYEPTLTSMLVVFDPVIPDLVYFFETENSVERLLSVDLASDISTTIYESAPSMGAVEQAGTMVIDQGSTRIFLNDLAGGIVAIDLNTGAASILSDSNNGGGPVFGAPSLMAFDADDNRLVVHDDTQQALYLIDAATGIRSIVSNNGSTGSGTLFNDPDAIVVDAARNVAVLHETGNTFLSVDLVTGARSIVAVSGDSFVIIGSVTSMDFDSQRFIIAVLDETGDSIVTVDPGTGERLSHSTGAGLDGFEAFGARQLSVYVVADRYVINDYSTSFSNLDTDRLLSVDQTGGRSVLFDDSIGSGPSTNGNASVAFDPANNALFLASELWGNISRVDVATGDRQVISDSGYSIGSGPAFDTIRDIVLDPSANRALVVDAGNASLMAVELTTGERTIISDSITGGGPVLSIPVALEADLDNNQVFILDQGLQAVVAVDLTTAERTIVPDDPDGPELLESNGLALDNQNNRLLITENGTGATAVTQLLSVDLTTGTRSIVSGFTVGSGPFLNDLRDVILLDNSDFAIVSGASQFYRVNLTTGNRQILAASDIANGEPVINSFSIAYDAANAVFYTWSVNYEAVFAFDVVTGDRVVVSK